MMHCFCTNNGNLTFRMQLWVGDHSVCRCSVGQAMAESTKILLLPRGVLCEEELLVLRCLLIRSWTKLSARLLLRCKSSWPHHLRTAGLIFIF